MAKIATKPYPILSVDALSHSIKIGALQVTEVPMLFFSKHNN